MRKIFATVLLAAALPGQSATIIDVSTRVAVPSVKRFGINLGWETYYDSAQITKNLIFRNPGFEGQVSQSIVHVASGTATGFVDDFATANWPAGFWNGASFEVIIGATKGRTGTIATMTAPSNPAGATYQFTDSGVAPAVGDYILLRKTALGGATYGWQAQTTNGGTVAGETTDLAPDTPGLQAVRLTATAAGATSHLATAFDTSTAGPFIQLIGHFRLSFKAKGVANGSVLGVALTRGSPANVVFLNTTVPLSGVWNDYNLDFTGADSGVQGSIVLAFTAVNPSDIELDDVSLLQTDGDPTNTTAFRDSVVNALELYHPGILRHWVEDLGDSLDNEIAPPFARQRESYSSQRIDPDGTGHEDLMYGLHEFLELCDLVHAEPWWIVPSTFTTQEMNNLVEYLSGPSTSPYGAKRAARGRIAPWTDTLPMIHLEFGNEAWNNLNYVGATIGNFNPPDPASYGMRGSEMFGVARSSPWYIRSKYDLILGGQANFPNRNVGIHNASTNHDSLALAPYIGGQPDTYDTNENLFGPLFAEPEMVDEAGYMRQDYNNMLASSRPVPLAVYEVNLHTTGGSITQARLNDFTPSIGAGLAVADHMLIMLRDLGIRNQCLYSLSAYANGRPDGKYVLLWGATRDMGVHDLKRPQFLAGELANEVAGGDLVQTTQSGDNPTWNQPLVNTVQYPNAHFIQSFAFVNGNRSGVIVFNLSRSSPLDVTFTGMNAPSGVVVMRQLTSAAITDNNETSANIAITTTNFPAFDPAAILTLPPFSMTVLENGPNPPAIPTGVSATAQSTSQISVNWNPSAGATQYQVARMANAAPMQPIATVPAPPLLDSGLASSTAYLYRVRAIGAGGTSPPSAPDVSTTVVFSDDPITSGQTIVRATHVTEVRTAIDAVRVLAGLAPQSWSTTIVPVSTVIAANDVLEMRGALTPAFSILGLPALSFANSVMPGATIQSADIQELRSAVR